LPLDPKGYPKGLRLGKSQQKGPGDFKCNPNFNWSPAQIVLVYNGIIPASLNLEASHLCNHNWCVNPNHLLWETREDNLSRRNCIIWTKCPCGCNHSFNPCIHVPQCLPLKYCNCKKHKMFNNN
jgi:hypothetical protein